MSDCFLSVVIPVYKSEPCILPLYDRLQKALLAIDQSFEILFVDDRSPDNAWELISALCAKDPRVKAIRLSRNFGQHRALGVGFAHASGQYVCVMDCDLQTDPQDIQKLVAKAEDDGCDVVLAEIEARQEGIVKRFCARAFYRIFHWMTNSSFSQKRLATFVLVNRKAVNAYNSLKEAGMHFFFGLEWVGFKVGTIKILHHARYAGKSSYTYYKLILHAINGIVSYSNRLLYFAAGLGLLNVAVALVVGLYVCVGYFRHGYLPGWASIVIVNFWSSGCVMLCLGVIGLYLAKMFEQVKQRPLYIIDEMCNVEQRVLQGALQGALQGVLHE